MRQSAVRGNGYAHCGGRLLLRRLPTRLQSDRDSAQRSARSWCRWRNRLRPLSQGPLRVHARPRVAAKPASRGEVADTKSRSRVLQFGDVSRLREGTLGVRIPGTLSGRGTIHTDAHSNAVQAAAGPRAKRCTCPPCVSSADFRKAPFRPGRHASVVVKASDAIRPRPSEGRRCRRTRSSRCC